VAIVNRVLMLGSGALKIGEAGEFDYSGSQAIKALKEEGVEVVLLNPNIATVQTDAGFADRIYFLPVTPEFCEKVIREESPDGILVSFGGQTALNCAVELHRSGVLERRGVRVLGTSMEAVVATEDRAEFAAKLRSVGVPTPEGRTAEDLEDALKAADEVGYPVMVRAAYALGGRGSGVARDPETLREMLLRAFKVVPQVLIEPYLGGWREVEYEVVRDAADNCVTVCNMENFDPMGVHTGESIVIAPSQTLTNYEYHMLREVAVKVVRAVGVVGECNIQFALSHDGSRFYAIEVNARLSRSSALASKATGYPLAYVAAKLALGHDLVSLRNRITGVTSACFEPALDYCVVKVPRWDFRKFERVDHRIGSEMKSVGEVMAIGRNFEEALQKALRAGGASRSGFETTRRFDDLERALAEPTPERIFAVGTALADGWSIERVSEVTGISPHFVGRLARIVACGRRLRESASLDFALLKEAKRLGFSDAGIAALRGGAAAEVRKERRRRRLRPFVKQIDTLAAEYPARTNYLYLTYNASEDDVPRAGRKTRSVVVLGSGPYCIGSSVEFDWCCVECVRTLRRRGVPAFMLNCNPETVSTDYDECDALYFEELSLERVLDICEHTRPAGVVVGMGGQIPNSLALPLAAAGVPILGTPASSIDRAEDRDKFSNLLDELGVEQPAWTAAESTGEALEFAARVGYPVLVRPSYVLSGAAMRIAHDDSQLATFLERAVDVSPEHPVVVSKFIERAKEIEFDGVAQDGEIKLYAITEHVEDAGVHSGDATLVLPAQRIWVETQRRIKRVAQRLAMRLGIRGPFNIQFIAKEGRISIIELNLRASRTFPFVSKVYNRNFASLATDVFLGVPVERTRKLELEAVAVKVPQFSFERLAGADPTTGVEMASTGEVACFGDSVEEAYLKALRAAGFPASVRSIYLEVGPEPERFKFLPHVERLLASGVRVYCPETLYYFFHYHGQDVRALDGDALREALDGHEIDLLIQIPRDRSPQTLAEGYPVRRLAADMSVPVVTNVKQARLLADSLAVVRLTETPALDWSRYWI